MAIGPGTIAFTGFNADANDGIAFVVLEAIPAGTTIIFSDREWTGAAFNSGEGSWNWTAPAGGVTAGTVVTLDNISDSDGVPISTNIGVATGGSGIGSSGEIVYAYIGADADTPSAFLAALASNTFVVDGGTLAGTGLTDGIDAISFGIVDADTDVASYNGGRSGEDDFASYAALINNTANWLTQDGTGDQSADGTAPDAPFSTQAFELAAPGNIFGGIEILDQAESLQGSVATPVATNALQVTRMGSWLSGSGAGGSEAIAFDPTTNRAYVTNAAADRIDILDLSDPAHPTKFGEIPLLTLTGYGNVNSVAVHNGLVAVAVQNVDGGEAGLVVLYDAAGALIKTIPVGVLPDQLTFSPDGNLLLVANEAERFVDRSGPAPVVEDAPGTITIIDVSGNPADAAVRNTIGFSALDGDEAALDALGIKTQDGTTVGGIAVPDATVSQDIEPEYIAVSPDGTRAYVTLQEINAVAVIDLTNAAADRPISLLPLGFVDFSLAGNEGDFSDRDGAGNTASISVSNSPIKSLLQPDAIATYEVGGLTYFITANEGDSRILQDSVLNDPSLNEARASAVQAGAPADYARLNLDTVWSTSSDLYGFGGRGFSIFQQNADGSIVKVEETGGDFEQILAALPNAGTVFNGENGGGFDSRSDNKGPEPEGVAVGSVNGTPYVFVALERIGGVMVWDVSTPSDAKFVQYIPPTSEDYGPEVIKFVAAEDSPTGRPMVMTANELTGSVTTYDIVDPSVTQIGVIQGTGHLSALDGQTVTTVGVVTAVDTNGSRGFFIQDPNGDGNAATSDGIFVFTNAAPTVTVGQLVKVTGVVDEFTATNAAPGSFSTTEIVATTAVGGVVTAIGTGPAIGTVVIGGADGLLPPASSLIDASAFYESLEGMLVTVKEAVVVGPTNDFGEIFVVVDNDADRGNGVNGAELNGRGALPIEPGAPDFGNTDMAGADFNPERLQIDDDSGIFNAASPSVSNGAQLGDVTGIVRYDFGNYEIVATETYVVDQPSALAKETTTLAGSATRLTVATYNAENLDPTDGPARFATIAQEILGNLKAPDIVALQEVQDSDGPGNSTSTVTGADVTLQTLIDAINGAAPAGVVYAFIDNPFIGDDTNGGQGGGNIRNAFIYRTDRVDLVDGSLRTVAADGAPISAAGGNTDQQTNADNPFFDSRPPLIATFEFNGQDVTIVNNHFTSKGGSGALYGSDDSPLNAGEVQRAAQAQAVNSFVDSLLATDPGAKVLVTGDFNDFPTEQPLAVLRGEATITGYDVPATVPANPTNATATYTPGGTAVLNDLVDTLPANERYDYVFEGNAQTLDHALVTNGLLPGAQFDVVRINAEFGDQTSDHDPLIASLEIPQPFTLQILHFYGEAGTLATSTAPILGAMVDKFKELSPNTLVVAEGDTWIPGPWLVAGADPSLSAVPGIGSTALARPDVAILNALGVNVSALGNHEFDLGSPVVSGAIAASGAWQGAQFPFITGNLDFSADNALRPLADASIGGNAANLFAGQEASAIKGKIAPYAVVTINGEKVGVVGATTYDLLIKTSPNGTRPKDDADLSTSDLQEVAAYIQASVDALTAAGVDKIVMVDQLDTIERNELLAPMVSGIDVMVAGGGHERQGDATDTPVAFNGHDADFVETYPIVATGLDGHNTLIVSTDTEFTYLGRLEVTFDDAGHIDLGSLDPATNGAYGANEATLQAVYGSSQTAQEIVAGSVTGSKVEAITDAINDVVVAKDGNKFGFSEVYLEGDRVFGRTQETNLGDVSADANIFAARQAIGDTVAIVAIKNGGGIRASIGTISADGDKLANEGTAQGNISQLDAENALRFDNRLMVFDATPQGLFNIVKYMGDLATLGAAGSQQGGFPQIGGLRFSFDPDLPVGQRVQNVALFDEHDHLIARIVENGVVLASAPALINVVILNFTANGGDGFPIKANGDNFRFLLTNGQLSAAIDESLDFTAVANIPANTLGELKAFEDFLQAEHGTPETAIDLADTPASGDLRIQNLNVRVDTVFATMDGDDVLTGTPVGDILDGGAGDDQIDGLDGNDVLIGGTGDDTLMGGNGDDTLRVDGSDLGIDGGAGFDSAFVQTGAATTLNMGTASIEWARGNTGDDTFDAGAQSVGAYLYGMEGNDTLTGSAFGDFLDGGDGNDTLSGGDGVDTLIGGNGADMLAGGNGDDSLVVDGSDLGISGGAGFDSVFVWSDTGVSLDLASASIEWVQGSVLGADTLNAAGNTANTFLYGWGGGDTLTGGSGDDYIAGGLGDDILTGGTGNDTLIGEAGVDQYVYTATAWGADTIHSFDTNGEKLDFTAVAGIDSFSDFTTYQWDPGNLGFNSTTLFYNDGVTTSAITLIGVQATSLSETDFLFA